MKTLMKLIICAMFLAVLGCAARDCQIAAYYFPQWHVDPGNEQLHGKNWSEWDIVPKAKSRFPGHAQPKIPAWGCELEDDPRVMAKKIATATQHGVDSFVFDWYYNAAGPFLNRALDRGFLGATNNAAMKFAVMWANHNLHNGPGAISEAVFVKATDHMIEHYFHRPNYWRVNGGLYVSIYEVKTLCDGLGGADNAAAVLQRFRERVRQAGCGELHLNAMAGGNTVAPDVMNRLGFDSVTSYHWIHHVAIPEFPAFDYAKYRELSFAAMQKVERRFGPLPYFPVVAMGWDASPRTPQDQPFKPGGYPWGAVLTNNTPAEFHTALTQARHWLTEHKTTPPILFVEAWNEWTEGSYLEPDTTTGLQYLEAVRDVFPQ